jgi:hypothetical protein
VRTVTLDLLTALKLCGFPGFRHGYYDVTSETLKEIGELGTRVYNVLAKYQFKLIGFVFFTKSVFK